MRFCFIFSFAAILYCRNSFLEFNVHGQQKCYYHRRVSKLCRKEKYEKILLPHVFGARFVGCLNICVNNGTQRTEWWSNRQTLDDYTMFYLIKTNIAVNMMSAYTDNCDCVIARAFNKISICINNDRSSAARIYTRFSAILTFSMCVSVNIG